MKAVAVIQEVQGLPRATARHRPGSNTRWREETHVRSRVEPVSRVCMAPRKVFASRGPARDTPPGPLDHGGGNCGPSPCAGTPYPPGRSRRDRVAATGVGDQIMWIQGEHGNSCAPHPPPVSQSRSIGASTARAKLPVGKARGPAGPIHLAKRGDDRHGGTSGNAKALRTGARPSERSSGAMAATPSTRHPPGNASGQRQSGETGEQEAARPTRQGPNAVGGPWRSAGDAGRPLRTTAGQEQRTPRPLPVLLRLERIATQARESPAMALPTLAPQVEVARLADAFRRLTPPRAPGGTG
jgi:hypothetical protein